MFIIFHCTIHKHKDEEYTHASKGRVVGVDANGKVRIKFQWTEGRPWVGDPTNVILDEN